MYQRFAAEEELSPGELDAIEQRARSVGGSYIHVPTVLTIAQHDVPALLAEVRRLRALREELCGVGVGEAVRV